ncbi:MAG: ATP-binding protein [Nitrospirota bacterium]
MRIAKNSLVFKILVPSLLFIALVALCMLFFAESIITGILEDYHAFGTLMHSREVQRILDRTVTELVSAHLLDNEIVVEAKKGIVIEEILSYWARNNLKGFVLDTKGAVVVSSHKDLPLAQLAPPAAKPGGFHVDEGGSHLQGYALEFPAWQWMVVTVSSPKTLLSYNKNTVLLVPLIGIGSLLMLVSIAFVLNRNLRRPIQAITADIRDGSAIRTTGIAELDTIASATNEAFRKLSKKTEQCQTLHSIALSLNEFSETETLLELVIDSAHTLIDAECAALVLFTDTGEVKRLITRGNCPADAEGFSLSGDVPAFPQLSLLPQRMNGFPDSSLPAGTPPGGPLPLRHLLSHPLLSDTGKALGTLLFINKEGGFTDDDENILAAIAADASVALNKSEGLAQLKRFKDVIDSAFDIIMITNTDGAITYVNPAFEQVTGYEAKEVLGKDTSILHSGFHDETFYRELWSGIRAGNIWKGEFVNRKKSGDIYHTSAVIFPIQTEGGPNYASIQRDVTQEKRLYEQLLRAQKMEAIGTLAGGIAHDFNNLLTAILGYSEIILHTAKEGDPFFKPASIIHHAAERGADLARKILTISRKEKLETKPLQVNEIISSCMELLQRSFPKNIDMVVTLAKDIPLIKADPSQMQQVIMNLAVNARDAMPQGGVLIIETALVGAENGAAAVLPSEQAGFIKISVSDTGTGMDKDTQRKIFDPFFTTKATGQGTGLGLYIVHSVTSNHGGYINLYSEPGKGTRFTLYLPVTREREVEQLYEAEDLRGSGTVLVIDDEAHIRELCRDLLVPLGYTVLTAGNGSEGISLFRQNQDDVALVILDMIMPGMGGNEVFQTLRTINPSVKVVLCSGYSYNGFAGIDTLLKSGAQSFIQKPFTRISLARTVRTVLGS